MSKAEAIKDLREALRIADLPNPVDSAAGYEKDEHGTIVAACMAFRVGYMSSGIKRALAELGVKDI